MDSLKKSAAEAALQYIKTDAVIGVGTGSTVNFFIEALANYKHKIEGAVASSVATAEKLKKVGITVLDLNTVDSVPLYVDGTDMVNNHLQMLKGGGGALTREKIVAAAATTFVCIADESKFKERLTTEHVPLVLEVIPMARSFVAREMVKCGAAVVYRSGYVTDNGNVILDVFNLAVDDPVKTETELNNIPGIVCHGLFARRHADILLLAETTDVKVVRAQ